MGFQTQVLRDVHDGELIGCSDSGEYADQRRFREVVMSKP